MRRLRGEEMKMVDRLSGALYGVAIGDAMGAPVEGLPGKVSLERYAKHDFRTFIPPRHGGDPNTGKGNGRITDDTLMTEVLIKAYGDAKIESVLKIAVELAKDGTRAAIEAACKAASPADDIATFARRVRAAVARYDQREGHAPDDAPLAMDAAGDIGRPSRVSSIEELPVALAALKYGDGDALKTLRAGVCYGRDCDSIAGMAFGVYGALFGLKSIPQALRNGVDAANRRSFKTAAAGFLETIRTIAAGDRRRWQRRTAALAP